MVLYQESAKAVTMVIKEAFPNVPIYGDEVREGYKTPSFWYYKSVVVKSV